MRASSPTVPGSSALLPSDAEWVRRLRLHAAVPPEQFDRFFLGPIDRLAVQVEALAGFMPSASAARSLLRACLQLAFFSYQGSGGLIFTGRESVEGRHALENRWRYICFAAGLVYPLHCQLECLESCVTTVAAGFEPRLTSIFGREPLEWLDSGGTPLTPALLSLSTRAPDAPALAASLLAGVWQQLQPSRQGPPATAALEGGTQAPVAADQEVEMAQGGVRNCEPPSVIPDTLRRSLGAARHVQALEHLVLGWRERSTRPQDMRMTPEGAAFALDMVVRFVREVAQWCDLLAAAGLLYSPPEAPGRRIHAVCMPADAAARPAIVLSRWACRALALDDGCAST